MIIDIDIETLFPEGLSDEAISAINLKKSVELKVII